MIALTVWQDLLYGLGWLLSKIYDAVPSYAVAILVLTVAIRLVLLPLGIRQVRSMQATMALQPKLKAIQQKYKGNRQKQAEEQQRLYREAGVSPFASCLPTLLQLPVLIALYAVLRFPTDVGAYPESQKPPLPNSHIPVHSRLYTDMVNQSGGVKIGGFDWLCAAGQAGQSIELKDRHGVALLDRQPPHNPLPALDCGRGIPVRIPFFVLIALMVATTYYQQYQMQKATPGGATQQQKTMTRVFPLMFLVWGWLFPAGLVLYWTISNGWQIGQQHFLIRAKAKDEQAVASGRAKPKPVAKRSRFAEWMERAQQADRSRRQGQAGPRSSAAGAAGDGAKGGRAEAPQGNPSGSKAGSGGGPGKASPQRSSGGRSGGNRKKRRKR